MSAIITLVLTQYYQSMIGQSITASLPESVRLSFGNVSRDSIKSLKEHLLSPQNIVSSIRGQSYYELNNQVLPYSEMFKTMTSGLPTGGEYPSLAILKSLLSSIEDGELFELIESKKPGIHLRFAPMSMLNFHDAGHSNVEDLVDRRINDSIRSLSDTDDSEDSTVYAMEPWRENDPAMAFVTSVTRFQDALVNIYRTAKFPTVEDSEGKGVDRDAVQVTISDLYPFVQAQMKNMSTAFLTYVDSLSEEHI